MELDSEVVSASNYVIRVSSIECVEIDADLKSKVTFASGRHVRLSNPDTLRILKVLRPMRLDLLDRD